MKLGFIGVGNMGYALVSGLKNEHEILAYDLNEANKERAKDVCTIVDSNKEIMKADVIFLCVKPQIISAVLEEVKDLIDNQIILSIAAGVTISDIKEVIGDKKIVRVMPNTPCLVGEMAAGYSCSGMNEVERENINKILNSVGLAYELSEDKIEAVTGLSGSGPAFVARLIQYFTEVAIDNGLKKDVAHNLAIKTFRGTAEMLKTMTPDELINMVSSPNGATIAGREVLENSDVKEVIRGTVKRCIERSIELGQK